MSAQPTVEQLAAEAADDGRLIRELAGVINEAYAAGEAGLWVDGTARIDPGQVADLVRNRGLLVATLRQRVVGCARVSRIDETTAELGLISAARDAWGTGVGRELVRAAEELARTRGALTMQLELLVPIERAHPHKQRLRAWYERLGYRMARVAPFEEVAEHASEQLATPSQFLVFRKPLL